VRNWFCNFILEPYRRLFEPGMSIIAVNIISLIGQADASFENTKRRFAWLKRTLKEF
jgi:hypothetical protein